MHRTVLFALAAAIAGSAAAQTPARPQAADPKAATASCPYESAFKDYRPYADPEIARWREANEEVGRLNGHVGHVTKRPGVAAKPAAKPPATGGHGAHK
jgi:hypothetical protein